MGEFIDLSASQAPIGLLSATISLFAFGIFALIETSQENDDDDSDSGSGGLMQPIAS